MTNRGKIRCGKTRATTGGEGGVNKMNYWVRTNLKFERLLGKDAKLTLAKVCGIPSLSFLNENLQFLEEVLVVAIIEGAFIVN